MEEITNRLLIISSWYQKICSTMYFTRHHHFESKSRNKFYPIIFNAYSYHFYKYLTVTVKKIIVMLTRSNDTPNIFFVTESTEPISLQGIPSELRTPQTPVWGENWEIFESVKKRILIIITHQIRTLSQKTVMKCKNNLTAVGRRLNTIPFNLKFS